MTINELLNNMNNEGFDFCEALEVKKYLSIEFKKTIAQGVIYESIQEDHGVLRVDSVQREMAYIRFMITTHTNLEYTDEDYDTLCSTMCGNTNLLGAIINCFDRDATECARILDLMVNDYMRETSIEFTVARFLSDVTDTINRLASKLEAQDFKSVMPEQVDMEKLNKFLNKYIK